MRQWDTIDDLEVTEGLRVRCGLRRLHRPAGGPHVSPLGSTCHSVDDPGMRPVHPAVTAAPTPEPRLPSSTTRRALTLACSFASPGVSAGELRFSETWAAIAVHAGRDLSTLRDEGGRRVQCHPCLPGCRCDRRVVPVSPGLLRRPVRARGRAVRAGRRAAAPKVPSRPWWSCLLPLRTVAATARCTRR